MEREPPRLGAVKVYQAKQPQGISRKQESVAERCDCETYEDFDVSRRRLDDVGGDCVVGVFLEAESESRTPSIVGLTHNFELAGKALGADEHVLHKTRLHHFPSQDRSVSLQRKED